MKTKFLAIGVFACAAAMAAERIGDWYVNVPAEVLTKMSMSERTCAERALKQLDGGSARAAANEWKRFNTEFITTAPEEALAWAATKKLLNGTVIDGTVFLRPGDSATRAQIAAILMRYDEMN